jgi:hypothetical protein
VNSIHISLLFGQMRVGQISVEDIVEYSQRISLTTSAPPSDELSENAFRRYKIPFPTEVEMQQTLLYSGTNPQDKI